MDLKALLLRSISGKKVLRRRQRLNLGKSCFIICYQLTGKFLSITKILRSSGNKLEQRKYLRKRLSEISRKLSRHSCKWSTTSLKPMTVESEIQTQYPKSKTKETETATIQNESKTQQTLHKKMRAQGTQTDLIVESLGIQTESHRLCQSNQTERTTISMCQQTENENMHSEVQTEMKFYCCTPMQTDADINRNEQLQVEKEAVVLLLNEIGEMIINQNHLLHNNSTMLGQISEMTMLNKLVSSQDAAKKDYEKYEKVRKIRKFFRKRRRTRYIFFRPEPKETIDVIVQTLPPEALDISTQTLCKEKRKFWT